MPSPSDTDLRPAADAPVASLPPPHRSDALQLAPGEHWIDSSSFPASSSATPLQHPMEDGIVLGVTIATAIWLWVGVVDIVSGDPLRLYTALGGIVVFTLVHYALCVMYGIALLAIVHAARSEPSLLAGMVFGLLLVEVAIVMVTIVLAQTLLGGLAWLQVFGGSVIAVGITVYVLTTRFDLRELLRHVHDD